ncbi:uncharacterized protein LOC6566819 [Drosophila grimshawi]|uniref:GH13693 n=1 Tax=Drosophila grimshawi TaxID=7222 RepID=B4JQG6_DROGR|nr:uncharacterized protein LOC6566819 [Drosophila grimshawi]EDV99146.1 GH13693 [Drosophila grimshawi]
MRHASLASWYASNTPMTHCSTLLLLLCLMLSHVRANDTNNNNNNNADELCSIRATLFVTPPEQRSNEDFGLPLDIDCAGANNNRSSSNIASAFDLSAQRVAGKRHVLLNGSQTPPLTVASYGLEYLDNCAELQTIEIVHFVLDASLTLSCNGYQLDNLQAVSLRHNELGILSGHSFELLPHLKQLQLEDNTLRLLETLSGGAELEQLIIRRERQLSLRQAEIFKELRKLKRLELIQLKLVEGDFLAVLPGQLEELLILQTPIVPRQLKLANGSDHLVNLTLVHCELNIFELEPSEESKLLHLNLSGNALRHLQVNTSSLISLDLSGNYLRSLNSSWFDKLPQLQTLLLQGNQLQRISWAQLVQLAPLSLIELDLSGNQLLRLDDTARAGWDQRQQLRIKIDDNPWSCQWLLNFSHTQPQLFRLFRYAKYISQINVNGLSCRPQLDEEQRQQKGSIDPTEESEEIQQLLQRNSLLNVSSHTVLFGNPINQSHSQRAEALIIVFMLPLGIALLFLLLYLYLHCERLFHWSYYSGGFPCCAGKSATSHGYVDHFDIVRYGNSTVSVAGDLEPQADGYETPLSGATSICNCAGHRQSTCSRSHHVTYEAMPTELPYQLYTEIKDQPDVDGGDQTPASTGPIYDQLTFEEEEKPLDV